MVFEIRLVSDQEEDGILFSIHLHFIHPKLNNAIKRGDIGNIENEENTLTASVIGTCDGSKSLLSSSIPDLKLDAFVIDGEGFEPEVDSDGGKIMLGELILYEPDENG